jgi:hypothetical protein
MVNKRTYLNAADELAARAKKYALEHGISYSEAADRVLESDPDLAQRYKWEDI